MANLEKLARKATQGIPPEGWYVLDGRRVSATEPCEPVEHCGYNSNCVAITYGSNDVCNAAFIAACSPHRILALLDVIKAAKAQVAAYDTLQDRPCGEFTGDELPACDRADEALRAALAAIGEQQ